MTTDKTARVEKLQFDIDREAAKILALSCGKIGEYKYWIKCRIHWTRPTIHQSTSIGNMLTKSFFYIFQFTNEHVGQVTGEHIGRSTGEHVAKVTGEHVDRGTGEHFGQVTSEHAG